MYRRFFVILTLAVAVLCAAPVVAMAAGDGHGEAHGNPIFPMTPDLFVWTLLVFLGLHFLMNKYGWQPILGGIKKREEAIESAVTEAEAARRETEATRTELEAKLKETYAEIPKILEQARKEAEAEREKTRTEAMAQMQEERAKLRADVESYREETLGQVRAQSDKLAASISSQLIGRTMSAEDHRAYQEEALAEL